MMAAKTQAVAELSTSEARSELEEIVTYFEQPSVDLDQLVTKLERATELAAELDRRITETRLKVDVLTPKLLSIAVDPETGEIVE